ncbi:GNAT family N-acetyltransferase [Cellulomonas hominis]
MELPLAVRPVGPDDVLGLAALNDAAVPAVNALGAHGLGAHLPGCDVALVVAPVGRTGPADVLGFVLALAPGRDYTSENYRWFSLHRPGSLYVDRIVVAPASHGRGVGRLLYDAVEAQARALGLAEITCEVNLEPPNPASLAFHDRLGFTRVGEQSTKGGSVRVALLARPVVARHGSTEPAP